MSSTTSTTALSSLVAEYPSADKARKAAIRTTLTAEMKGHLKAGRFVEAQDTFAAIEALAPASAPKAEVDWSQKVADRRATLVRALAILDEGTRPEGVPSEVTLEVREGVADEDKASAIALARVTRNAEGVSIQDVVTKAFEGLKSGAFLTFAQVAQRGGHPNGSGATGALAARVDWNTLATTLEGVVPQEAVAGKSPKGLVKA